MPKAPADKPAQSVKKRGSKASKSSLRVKKSASKATESQTGSETASTGDSVTLTELLSSSTACLPKRYDEDVERYLAQLFKDYAEGVARLSTNGTAAKAVRDEIETIRILSDGILVTLDQYFSGHTFDAFQTFSEAIGQVRHWLQGLVVPLVDLLGVPLSEPGSEHYGDLYRLRTGPLTQLTQRDLFHIPFEKRQLVASQRYSIPGLPSLYLASSLWIAWEELGRPDLASLHASRFEGKGDLKVLDFGWSPSLAAGLSTFGHSDGAEAFGEFAKGQAIIWPLIAACSLVRCLRKRRLSPSLSIYGTQPPTAASNRGQLQSVMLPAARIHLTIILPRFSQGGQYLVAVTRDQNGNGVVAESAAATKTNGAQEKVSVDLDLRSVKAGTYFLSTTHERDQAAHYYPLQIKCERV